MAGRATCPLFPVRSGIPVIGLGLFVVAIAVVIAVTGNRDAFPLPLVAIFVAFGLFLIWLGATK